MTAHVITAQADDTIDRLAKIMFDKKFTGLLSKIKARLWSCEYPRYPQRRKYYGLWQQRLRYRRGNPGFAGTTGSSRRVHPILT